MQYLTQEDLNNYGSELIDVTQRAAVHAVAPHLQALDQQNAELRQRLAIEARRNLDAAIERALPNYREIDRDPNWHRWLLTVDALSGRVRQELLNEAIASGVVARVLSFFYGFLQEEGHASTGQASLAAPGRARSARSDKPTYTRDQIAQLYAARRKGAYVGREAEWARQEADIFAAQREGRVLGHPYLTK